MSIVYQQSNNMKKKYILSSIIAIILCNSSNPSYSFAQITPGDLSNNLPTNIVSLNINTTIQDVINFAIGTGIVVFLLMFAWASLQWLTSQGDKMTLQKARDRMIAAAIGLILLLCTFAIFTIIQLITYSGPTGSSGSNTGYPDEGKPRPTLVPACLPAGELCSSTARCCSNVCRGSVCQ
jgi:lysylphosphatidylglycerol synthetase-like protein (DUF2156 family)